MALASQQLQVPQETADASDKKMSDEPEAVDILLVHPQTNLEDDSDVKDDSGRKRKVHQSNDVSGSEKIMQRVSSDNGSKSQQFHQCVNNVEISDAEGGAALGNQEVDPNSEGKQVPEVADELSRREVVMPETTGALAVATGGAVPLSTHKDEQVQQDQFSEPELKAAPRRKNIVSWVIGVGIFTGACLLYEKWESTTNHPPTWPPGFNCSSFLALEAQIPTAAWSLDEASVEHVSMGWKRIQGKLQVIGFRPNFLSKSEKVEIVQVIAQHSGATWQYIVGCARDAHPGCGHDITSVCATTFLQDVQATRQALSEVHLLPDCEPLLHQELAEDAPGNSREGALQKDLQSLALQAQKAATDGATRKKYEDAWRSTGTEAMTSVAAAVAGVNSIVSALKWSEKEIGVEGVLEKQAQAVVADAAAGCATGPQLLVCMEMGATIVSVAAIAFAAGVLTEDYVLPFAPMNPIKTTDMENFDHALKDGYAKQAQAGEEVSTLKAFAQIPTAKAEVKRGLTSIINSSVTKLQMDVEASVEDLGTALVYGRLLKQNDDDRVATWRYNKDHCEFFCDWRVGDEPRRVVPQEVTAMTLNLQMQMMDFKSSVTFLTLCAKNVAQPCDHKIVLSKTADLQMRFHPVHKSWTTYKKALCMYNGWQVCTQEIVLAGLKKLHQQRTPRLWSAGAFAFPFGISCAAFTFAVVGSAMSKKKRAGDRKSVV